MLPVAAGLAGAVLGADGQAVTHFGNPLKEGREFEAGKALVVRSDLAVVRVEGTDAVSWLNSFSTQNLATLQPLDSAETLILSPQGKIEQQLMVLCPEPELLYLVTPLAAATALIEFLLRMRFRARVEITDVSDAFVAFTGCVPLAAKDNLFAATAATRAVSQLLSAAELAATPVWFDPWSWRPQGGVQYAAAAHPSAQEPGMFMLLLTRECAERVVTAAGEGQLNLAGLNAVAAFEVVLWRPGTAEFDDRALPHEYDLLRSSVHLNKGCYRGQETVAKVHNLGHPPRRLVQLDIDGSAGELPAAGNKLFLQPAAAAGGVTAETPTDAAAGDVAAEAVAGASVAVATERPIGRLTRAVLHHEYGPVALALVKRTAPLADTYWIELQDGGRIAATPVTIVPPDAGAARALDAETRRALLSR